MNACCSAQIGVKMENIKTGEIKIGPAAGEFYMDSEGKKYQIIGRAFHSETGAEMVIYQALFGEYQWQVQELAQFKLRQTTVISNRKELPSERQTQNEINLDKGNELQQAEINQSKVNKQPQVNITPDRINNLPEADKEESEEAQVQPELLAFLNAENATEKLSVLRWIRRKMDEPLLTSLELSLDLVPNEKESMERRLNFVERTLEIRARYENSRLR